MSVSVVLGTRSVRDARPVEDLLDSDPGFDVRAVATTPEALLAAVLDHEPDVVLLHEDFGPSPALTVSRDLVERLPWVSVVLLSREPSVELYAAAGDAGVRSLVTLPPSLADVTARLTAGAWWSRTVRLGSEAKRSFDELGTVLTVVGAKGGVGATTIATQLAFVATGPRDRRVCLVDLDLYGADLAAYLGTDATRTLRELVDLSDELSPGVLQPVLYPHESGVRILFSPEDVTETELITPSVVRRTIGVLRSMFDVVVVDCGSHVVEAALPAVELADRIALVATPDLLALRAAHRMVETWERLDARRTDTVELVLNRVSRGAAVQPRLVGQTAAMPVCRVAVPAAFSLLEPLANEGASGLRRHRTLARPFVDLARHFGVLPPKRSGFAPLWRRRRPRPATATTEEAAAGQPATVGGGSVAPPLSAVRATVGTDSGEVPAEVAASGVVLVLGVLLLVQLLLLAWAGATLAVGTPAAARAVSEGASVENVQEDLRAGGDLLSEATVSRRGDRVVVSVPVPAALPLTGEPLFTMTSDAGVTDDAPAGS
ncbi:MAG: P-loop NTPase [Kineosporiaceae bacterium]